MKIAIIASFAHIVEGHVRALPTGADGVGCRECNGKGTPGPYRTNGALGGGKAFGANGVTKVTPGQEIELAIGYNGGHQDPNKNIFYVRYACGAATGTASNFNKGCGGNTCTQLTANQITEVDGQPATTANYPVDASQSKRDGYKVKFKIPDVPGAGEQRKCTFALVEGRNWGMGWDFDIQAAGAAQPATTQAPAKSVAGTYVLNQAACQKDAPNCECLEGQIIVKHSRGQTTATAYLDIKNYPKHEITLSQKIPGAWSTAKGYVLANCGQQSDNDLDISLSPDAQTTGLSLLNIGVTTEIPTVCGSVAKTSSANSNYPTAPKITQCDNCQDIAGWKDNGDDGCDQYTTCANGGWRLKGLDYYKQFANAQGQSARNACCVCGGGTSRQIATTPATTPATQSPVTGTTAGNGGNNEGNNGGTTRRSMFDNQAVAAAQTVGIAFGTLLTACTAVFM